MPYTAVDPARLSGDALDAWYRRSPLDIERERQAAERARYKAFFGTGANSDEQPDTAAVSFGGRSDDHGSSPVQLASSSWNCSSCHGGSSPPLPPITLPPPPVLPFPWSVVTSFRDGSAGGASKPPPPDRKQCDMQERRDSDVCGRQPNRKVEAVCRERSAVRNAHCLSTGEVDRPISLLWF
jgi:hypothetical protein